MRPPARRSRATAELTGSIRRPAPAPRAVSLESVAISGADDVERLERLGLDVTHDVTDTTATVALYSDAERALLDRRVRLTHR